MGAKDQVIAGSFEVEIRPQLSQVKIASPLRMSAKTCGRIFIRQAMHE